MAVSERTRKILWVTAGGRCSICRAQLVTEGTETDDPSVFGEEAHIVAHGDAGPRAGQVPNIDSYENLILLCSKDHKRVDDQVGSFTVARLREIKRSHEQWIRSLVDSTGDGAESAAHRLHRIAEGIRREKPEKLKLRYLDHWRDDTQSACITWLDGQGSEHQRVVTDEHEALKLLGMIEDDRTLRVISCVLS